MYALTLKEQQEDRKLKILERKAAKRVGKIPQRTFENISPPGQTVIKTTLGDRTWLVTLSRALKASTYSKIADQVKKSSTLSEVLALFGVLEKQHGVAFGLVPETSILFRPTIAREKRVLASLAN